MSGESRFPRLLSRREKKRGPSQHRPCSPSFNGLFTRDEDKKKASRDEEKKVQDLMQKLSALGRNDIPEARVEYAVRDPSCEGDIDKSFRLLMLFEDSVAGILKPYDPRVKMLGAVNRDKSTCWLDTLLFAMFAKVDVFEAMLFNQFKDEGRKRLVALLRLWVNMLRTGRLITTDITRHLQEAIADIGWSEAAKLRQHDASEAFGFITDKLNLPLLTLKTDIYHDGKEDASDDHKFITERMLDVAIPEGVPNDLAVPLEKCLEEYFNNRVEVKRHLQRVNTAISMRSRASPEKSATVHMETFEVDSSPTPSTTGDLLPQSNNRPSITNQRTASIFSDRTVELVQEPTEHEGDASAPARGRPRNDSMLKKEVLMPAWQFLSLIPWYTDNPVERFDVQMAAHFSTRRPMLGICLKRYTVSADGAPRRLNTHVDVPLELGSPHFVSSDKLEDASALAGNFKLSLQSMVCHRGVSVTSGHYIAIVRVPSPDSNNDFIVANQERPHDRWLRLDDMAHERVALVDIQQALKDETPYLLFYRVEPITADLVDEPPPYVESQKESYLVVDQKVASVAIEAPSLSDDVDDSRSGRASLDAITQVGIPRRTSLASQRRKSIAWQDESSARIEQTETEPMALLDNVKSNAYTISRQNTKNGRTNRPPGETNEKRFSISMNNISMGRISSRLSRDKLTAPDVVVDEVLVNGALKITDPVLVPDEWKGDVKLKVKVKEKRKKFNPMSRRGSGNEGRPSRECIVM